MDCKGKSFEQFILSSYKMNITTYVLNEIKPLELHNTVAEAKVVFDQFPFTHYPVIEKGKLVGSFAEDDVHTSDKNEEELLNYYHFLHLYYATKKDSLLELLLIFSTNNTNIVPVVDKDNNYLGYYDLCDVLEVFTSNPFFEDDSTSLMVKKLERDFSMSEIAQIVESNGAELLGSFLSKRDGESVEITLNVKAMDINEIMHTFRRYNYTIISAIDNDEYMQDLKSRSDYLKKYLEL